jgi:flagellar export protein FliJ
MAFQFTLATLLRLREIAEQREERLLGQIQAQIAQSHQTLIDLAVQRQSLVAHRERMIQQIMPSAEIVGLYNGIRRIEELEQTGRAHLVKLQGLRIQQMKAYEIAHKNKELLTGLRKEQLDAYRSAQTRHEQSALDDNFSSRRHLR